MMVVSELVESVNRLARSLQGIDREDMEMEWQDISNRLRGSEPLHVDVEATTEEEAPEGDVSNSCSSQEDSESYLTWEVFEDAFNKDFAAQCRVFSSKVDEKAKTVQGNLKTLNMMVASIEEMKKVMGDNPSIFHPTCVHQADERLKNCQQMMRSYVKVQDLLTMIRQVFPNNGETVDSVDTLIYNRTLDGGIFEESRPIPNPWV